MTMTCQLFVNFDQFRHWFFPGSCRPSLRVSVAPRRPKHGRRPWHGSRRSGVRGYTSTCLEHVHLVGHFWSFQRFPESSSLPNCKERYANSFDADVLGVLNARSSRRMYPSPQAPAKCLGCAPLALGEIMRQSMAQVAKDTAETLAQLLAPACATISEGDTFVPAVQAGWISRLFFLQRNELQKIGILAFIWVILTCPET